MFLFEANFESNTGSHVTAHVSRSLRIHGGLVCIVRAVLFCGLSVIVQPVLNRAGVYKDKDLRHFLHTLSHTVPLNYTSFKEQKDSARKPNQSLKNKFFTMKINCTDQSQESDRLTMYWLQLYHIKFILHILVIYHSINLTIYLHLT